MALGLLTILDDITMMADDVATMTKVAAKKVTGVLSDDVALNAHQVSGFSPSRELPVVWAVAKGSAINKAIIVPVALLLVAVAPWALTPILMLGGAFLCFEGVEKVFHKFLHSAEEDQAHHDQLLELAQMSPEQIMQHEKEKAKGAIRTDAILSAEIIVIALGTMQGAPFSQQALTLVVVSVVFTVGVYGLVAAIVKLDDLGFYLEKSARRGLRAAGSGLIAFVPYLMKALSFLGTAALFLVGGGIIAHGTPPIHHFIESIESQGGALSYIAPALGNLLTGLAAGTIVLGLVMLYKKLFVKNDTAH
ncbi:MAG: DUF808 domain-containing protein [Massilia sp.]|nr:MAG: DUF808 domain-containing protein [Massilia sp.]